MRVGSLTYIVPATGAIVPIDPTVVVVDDGYYARPPLRYFLAEVLQVEVRRLLREQDTAPNDWLHL
jgi:hypothetical protein